MSVAESVSTPSQATRRFHARRKIDGLAYVEFGQENGAILIDLSEGGLGFQSVLPVSMSDALLFKFKFPGESNHIEGLAEVAWMNESGKGGGLRFMEVSAEAREKIREWAGASAAPDAGALHGGNGTAPRAARETVAEDSQVRAVEPTAEPQTPAAPETLAAPEEALEKVDATAEGSEELTISPTISVNENAQPPSPLNEMRAAEDAEEEETETKDFEEEIAAEVRPAAPPVPAPSIPEFTIEVAPAADTSEPMSRQRETWPQAGSGFVASKSTLPHPPAQTVEKNGEFAEQPASRPGPKEPVTRGAEARGAEMTKGAANPAQRTRKRPVSKPETKLESAVPASYWQEGGTGTVYARKTPKPVAPSPQWENWEAEPDTVTPRAKLVAQALRVGTGAAAGAGLVLALFLAVPSLRTRVEATAGTRSGALNLVSAPAFQVEIADLNNRRWILRSGGEAASPFSEVPPRRDAASGVGASSRAESAKPNRPEESDDSSNTVAAKQPKLSKASELALARPRTTTTAAASAQLLAPSIFDGITPPIGSVSAPLGTGGPEAPGIVPPEGQPLRATTLQSAVLTQRVSPVYPAIALEERIQGDVQVNATIGKDGIPKDLKVISGDVRLAPAALSAIRQWRYRPATLAGEAIETQIVITVSFQLK